MKTVGIIAEYNPFHNGHQYQIAQARRLCDADYVVVVMSGSFVQRGTPAWTDKYLRAQIALQCGADMVFELPTAYATASAKDFAYGGISLLHGLSFVDAVCFGSECGDIHILQDVAQFLEKPTEAFEHSIRDLVQSGLSYPAARAQALAAHYPSHSGTLPSGLMPSYSTAQNDFMPSYPTAQNDLSRSDSLSALLESPNNILGIEYLTALHRLHSTMQPVTIPRADHGYHEENANGKFLSATGIRKAFQDQHSLPSDYMPTEAVSLLQDAVGHYPIALDDFSDILYYRLSTCSFEEAVSFADVSEALAARIFNLLPQFTSASSFAMLVKSKQYTYSRVCRALLHILLHITAESSNTPAPYANLLGFRDCASTLLRQADHFPIITKKADALRQFTKLTDASAQHARALWNTDLLADNLYRHCILQKTGCVIPDCYHTPLIRID